MRAARDSSAAAASEAQELSRMSSTGCESLIVALKIISIDSAGVVVLWRRKELQEAEEWAQRARAARDDGAPALHVPPPAEKRKLPSLLPSRKGKADSKGDPEWVKALGGYMDLPKVLTTLDALKVIFYCHQ